MGIDVRGDMLDAFGYVFVCGREVDVFVNMGKIVRLLLMSRMDRKHSRLP